MIENFIAYNPTKLCFGKGVIKNLPQIAGSYSKNVLFVYGCGSVKQNKVYEDVTDLLKKSGKNITEVSGIKPNPDVEIVQKAIDTGRKNNAGLVIAAGGGSVIDSAKIIALCIPENLNPWQVMKYQAKPSKALPLITILTVAGTGTEMNQFAVLQNNITREKTGFASNLIYPTVSFCDPSYTLTVSKYQTACGLADIASHALEAYFGSKENFISDRFVVSVIKEVAGHGIMLLSNPGNYDLRADIMLTSTCALNGITFYGRASGDWGVHDIGHVLSVLYDLPHGASLSIAYPAWLKYNSIRLKKRILWLGKEIFNTGTVESTISSFEKLFVDMGCPVNLKSAGISIADKKELEETLIKNNVNGLVHKLTKQAISEITNLMYND